MSNPNLLMKPTLETRFHIDYDWWEQNREDLRSYLLSHLPVGVRERLSKAAEGSVVDFINPDTGEVFKLDELGLAIQTAANDPDFINPHTSLVDSVFRVFLKNGNVPLTPKELSMLTGRPNSLILKTLGGIRVYKGIRPYYE